MIHTLCNFHQKMLEMGRAQKIPTCYSRGKTICTLLNSSTSTWLCGCRHRIDFPPNGVASSNTNEESAAVSTTTPGKAVGAPEQVQEGAVACEPHTVPERHGHAWPLATSPTYSWPSSAATAFSSPHRRTWLFTTTSHCRTTPRGRPTTISHPTVQPRCLVTTASVPTLCPSQSTAARCWWPCSGGSRPRVSA
jgi:hypothetical protein